MSSTDFDEEDLDAFAEKVAKRTAERESKLQRLAMLKGQQLENDEEEFQKLASKKQATVISSCSKTSAISTSKSPQKTANFNFSSPSKNQFLPSFDSPQRSFAITKSIEKSPTKELSTSIKNDLDDKTPTNSPEKQLNTTSTYSQGLQSSSSVINLCSPKPYQKSPVLQKPQLKKFLFPSPSHVSISSNFTKKVFEFSSPTNSLASSKSWDSNDILSNTSSVNSTNQLAGKSKIDKSITPTKSISPVKKLIDELFDESQQTELTNSENFNLIRLFSSVKSTNPIKNLSPIKKVPCLNTPERLCVSDKKKLFENAIKEETENARRVQDQKMFLLRKKFPDQQKQNKSPLSKKIKTSVFENYNESPSQCVKTSLQAIDKIAPKILDVEMKQISDENVSIKQVLEEDVEMKSNDEISKFIQDQPTLNKSTNYFENSLDLIEEEGKKMSELNEIEQIHEGIKQKKELEDDEEQLKNQLDIDSNNLIKSSTKANLYPNLEDLNEFKKGDELVTSDLEKIDSTENDLEQIKLVNDNLENIESTESNLVQIKITSSNTTPNTFEPIIRHDQNLQNKPSTPIRTLSQYRREQKEQRAVMNPKSLKLDIDKHKKEQEELDKLNECREKLTEKLIRLKTDVEKYDKIIEQSSKAIATCLKSSEHKSSTLQKEVDKIILITTQLEAEKILLVSSQKKDACLQEIDVITNKINLIKKQISLGDYKTPDSPLVNGCVTIERIEIPVGSNFVISQLSDDIFNYHFICIAKCHEKVLESELLDSANSIQGSSITFKQKLQFENLDKDFEIQLEIYYLTLPKEKSHYDKKSLIKQSIKIPPLSPKLSKNKKTTKDQGLWTYSTNEGFTRLGSIKFNINNIKDKKYQLEDFILRKNNSCVSGGGQDEVDKKFNDRIEINAPISGQIEIDFKLNAEYNFKEFRDYLNFYDESTEIACWSRRLCILKGCRLGYWKYEKENKESDGVIDLKNCTNIKIGQVDQRIHPRQFTFELKLKEDKYEEAGQNKVYITKVKSRQLIAADVKEDFEKWCNILNRLLPLIRIWEIEAEPAQD